MTKHNGCTVHSLPRQRLAEQSAKAPPIALRSPLQPQSVYYICAFSNYTYYYDTCFAIILISLLVYISIILILLSFFLQFSVISLILVIPLSFVVV